MRQGRGRGGWVRKKEETRQKFAIMSVEEGGRRCSREERGFSGWWRSGRESGHTPVNLNRDICQGGCWCVCVSVIVIVCLCVRLSG